MSHKWATIISQLEHPNCPGFPGACYCCLLTRSLPCLFFLYRPFSGSLRFVQPCGHATTQDDPTLFSFGKRKKWEIQLLAPPTVHLRARILAQCILWFVFMLHCYMMMSTDIPTSPRWNLTSVAPGIKAQISVESSAPSRFHNSHYNRCSVQNASVEVEAMFPPLALEILPSLWSPWCPPRESRRAFCHAGHRLRAVSEWLQWSDSPQVMVFW